ncbi:MAG: bifunctional UDP-N-acetylglucosamine diphosphorylase/glucosamine-1-phosphate N-acetyltransferase GlmU [Myxococcota bacterium]
MSVCSVVLCAGNSTRMHSAHSKMVHPLCGQPICFWVLDTALAANQGPVVAVVQRADDPVAMRVAQHYGSRVQLVYQQQPQGTGDAVRVAMQQIDSSCQQLLVLYGDTPLLRGETLQRLVAAQQQTQALVTMLTSHCDNPTGYGRIVRNEQGSVVAIVEERQANAQQKQLQEINPGVYLFAYDFLASALPRLALRESVQEYQLTDCIAAAQLQSAQHAKAVADVPVATQEILGINNRRQLAMVQEILRQRIVQHWMNQGVSCVDPQRTYIDADCVLQHDVLLEPGVMLRGCCYLHEGVHVSAGCILTDCVVEQGVCLLPYSVCDGMHAQAGARIGPFARVRPDTVVGPQARVGNFVEVKAATLRQGVKVNHLAYVGNAHVGQNSNVGAGAVVCNYDGVAKHHTHVDSQVFVGSNSTLVAPVRVGQGAYVAAGSVVTQDVAANALAIARGKQYTKQQAALALRERLQQHKDSGKIQANSADKAGQQLESNSQPTGEPTT